MRVLSTNPKAVAARMRRAELKKNLKLQAEYEAMPIPDMPEVVAPKFDPKAVERAMAPAQTIEDYIINGDDQPVKVEVKVEAKTKAKAKVEVEVEKSSILKDIEDEMRKAGPERCPKCKKIMDFECRCRGGHIGW